MKIIANELEKCDEDFREMNISLIESMREGSIIFAAEELDIHLS